MPRLLAAHRCGVLAATVTAAGFAQALRQALTAAPTDDLATLLEQNS